MNFSFQHLLSLCPEPLRERVLIMKTVPQRLDHHPENDCLTHIAIVCNRLSKYRTPTLSWASVFHDLGKLECTKENDKGILQAIGHEEVSTQLVSEYSYFLAEQGTSYSRVAEIVANHMRIKLLNQMRLNKQVTMRELSTFGLLQLFAEADDMSNPVPTAEEIERVRNLTL